MGDKKSSSNRQTLKTHSSVWVKKLFEKRTSDLQDMPAWFYEPKSTEIDPTIPEDPISSQVIAANSRKSFHRNSTSKMKTDLSQVTVQGSTLSKKLVCNVNLDNIDEQSCGTVVTKVTLELVGDANAPPLTDAERWICRPEVKPRFRGHVQTKQEILFKEIDRKCEEAMALLIEKMDKGLIPLTGWQKCDPNMQYGIDVSPTASRCLPTPSKTFTVKKAISNKLKSNAATKSTLAFQESQGYDDEEDISSAEYCPIITQEVANYVQEPLAESLLRQVGAIDYNGDLTCELENFDDVEHCVKNLLIKMAIDVERKNLIAKQVPKQKSTTLKIILSQDQPTLTLEEKNELRRAQTRKVLLKQMTGESTADQNYNSEETEMSNSKEMKMSTSKEIEMSTTSKEIELSTSNEMEMSTSKEIEISNSKEMEKSDSNDLDMSHSKELKMSNSKEIEKYDQTSTDLSDYKENLYEGEPNDQFYANSETKKSVKIVTPLHGTGSLAKDSISARGQSLPKENIQEVVSRLKSGMERRNTRSIGADDSMIEILPFEYRASFDDDVEEDKDTDEQTLSSRRKRKSERPKVPALIYAQYNGDDFEIEDCIVRQEAKEPLSLSQWQNRMLCKDLQKSGNLNKDARQLFLCMKYFSVWLDTTRQNRSWRLYCPCDDLFSMWGGRYPIYVLDQIRNLDDESSFVPRNEKEFYAKLRKIEKRMFDYVESVLRGDNDSGEDKTTKNANESTGEQNRPEDTDKTDEVNESAKTDQGQEDAEEDFEEEEVIEGTSETAEEDVKQDETEDLEVSFQSDELEDDEILDGDNDDDDNDEDDNRGSF